MEAIKVEHLSFGYTGDVPILEDVNLKIDEGDYVILDRGKRKREKYVSEAGIGTVVSESGEN